MCAIVSYTEHELKVNDLQCRQTLSKGLVSMVYKAISKMMGLMLEKVAFHSLSSSTVQEGSII